MNTKWKRLATVLWIWSVVLATWIGVYAAKNEAQIEWAMNRERSQMEMRQQLGSGEMERWRQENRFWFAFIDQENLTEEQKAEIEKLQEERDEAIKKINDEFFDKLEKFISEEKLEDYENFVENHENIKWMPQQRWEHKMKGDCPMKDIQKPKETNEE
jgi:hypothetical protein